MQVWACQRYLASCHGAGAQSKRLNILACVEWQTEAGPAMLSVPCCAPCLQFWSRAWLWTMSHVKTNHWYKWKEEYVWCVISVALGTQEGQCRAMVTWLERDSHEKSSGRTLKDWVLHQGCGSGLQPNCCCCCSFDFQWPRGNVIQWQLVLLKL